MTMMVLTEQASQQLAVGLRRVALLLRRFRGLPARRRKQFLLVGAGVLVAFFYLSAAAGSRTGVGRGGGMIIIAGGNTQTKRQPHLFQSNDNALVLQQDLQWGGGATATLVLELEQKRAASSAEKDDDANKDYATAVVATGSGHKAHVVLVDNSRNKECPDPRFAVRLAGPTLVPIRLVQQQQQESSHVEGQQLWTAASVNIPLAGTYRVEAKWYGCHHHHDDDVATTFKGQQLLSEDTTNGEKATATTTTATLEFVAEGPLSWPAENDQRLPKESHLFANAAWMPTKEIVTTTTTDTAVVAALPDYMWLDPALDNPITDDFQHFAQEGESEHGVVNTTISLRGTFTDAGRMAGEKHGYYLFHHVGNYELVCFWGGPTMVAIRRRFLLLRARLAPGVRPFKFHYYSVTNLRRPDADWTDQNRARCRKCKHIFVSVDELIDDNDNGNGNGSGKPLSQSAFREQYTTFVRHLLRLMDDDTFPIWLLTISSEAPSNATNCHVAPLVLPRSTDHPCNDVIRDLFREDKDKAAAFPDRVHLLDNTDLVLPLLQWDDDNKDDDHDHEQRQHQQHRDHVLFHIALRIMTAVGRGVANWRAAGQQGLADGLHRNNTLAVPNFPLVPYDWGSELK